MAFAFVIASIFAYKQYSHIQYKREYEALLSQNKALSKSIVPQPTLSNVPGIIYSDFEPPLHPLSQEMLDNIDKSKVDPEKLNWVPFSDMYKSSGLDDVMAFDFDYPNDYFVDSISLTHTYCAELRGKEEVMFEFCYLADNNSYIKWVQTKQFNFTNTIEFNGRKGLYRTAPSEGVFPREEMLFVNNDETDNVIDAIYLKMPRAVDDDYMPENIEEWAIYKDDYINVDLPIKKKILDSFIFKL